jgi:hypothetical protein
MKKSWMLVVITCWVGVAGGAEPNVFRNDLAGFELQKPADWHYISAARNLQGFHSLKLSDPELRTAVRQYAAAPLVVMSKYPASYKDHNPTQKID